MPNPPSPADAINARMAAIKSEQEPAREQIAKLQASLAESDTELDRLGRALAVLTGEAPAPRSRRASGGPRRALNVDDAQIMAAVKRLCEGGKTTTAPELRDALNVPAESNNAFSQRLGRLVRDGQIVGQGDRRSKTYSLPA